MSKERLGQFEGQKYLNLESYRKTGAAVATPVWFADDGNELYIYSLADAGKVKRIRNNPRAHELVERSHVSPASWSGARRLRDRGRSGIGRSRAHPSPDGVGRFRRDRRSRRHCCVGARNSKEDTGPPI